MKRENKFALACWCTLVFCAACIIYNVSYFPTKALANPDYNDNLNRIVKVLEAQNELLEKQNRILETAAEALKNCRACRP